MLSLEVSGDSELIVDFTNKPRWVSLSMVRAINRGIAAARTFLTKAISDDIGLKQSDVREALIVKQANLSRPKATLYAGLDRIPLIKFGARGPMPSKGEGGGVTARLKGGSGSYPHAFVAEMSSGHIGVFERVTGKSSKKSHGAWGPNLPIRELKGPSYGHVFLKYRPAALARADEIYSSNLSHELDRRQPAEVSVSESVE